MSAGRRGRPRAGEREERRGRILRATEEELAHTGGYDGVTMLGIARRAGASKETLYAWFESREGLFAALIESNAEEAAAAVENALAGDGEPREVLVGFGMGLLALLTGDASIALNRAAMASPDLAEVLLASGRHRVGPLVEEYLGRLDEDGAIAIEDPAEAFRLLYGLIVRDSQIRVLLGESAPSARARRRQAEDAVDAFLRLVGSEHARRTKKGPRKAGPNRK